MLLYFENSKGQRRLISTPTTVSNMWEDINHFMDEHNYKAPYTIINFGEKELVIDVGSHSEFFIVEDFNLNEFKGGSHDFISG